jgi:C4-dicarboxylate transporter DctM subunit
MSLTATGIIGIIVLLLLFFSGMQIAFAMALVGIVGFSYLVSVVAGLSIVATDLFHVFSSYTLTVVPMFVLMGSIAFYSGMSGRLYDAADKYIGHVRGGLAMATILACAGFAAICGSTNAAAAAMSKVSMPEMKRYNYANSLAAGTVAAGGSLGILIPPSTIFIIYGVMVGESIGKLFLAGIIPGILLACLWILTVYIHCLLNPRLGPAGTRVSFKEKLGALTGLIEVVILFLLVMSGLFAGIFTPTEAGGIGALGSLVIALARRKLTRQAFLAALVDTARLTCMIFFVLAGATIFGRFLTVTKIPFNLASWVNQLPLSPNIIMMLIIFIYFIGGFFMDSLALITLTIPIFTPIAVSLGFNRIWFGVIIVLVTEMGVITPPVGINVYVVKGVAPDMPLETIFRGASQFLIGLAIVAIMLIAFPEIALFLPNLTR